MRQVRKSREGSLIREYLTEKKIGGTVVWEFRMGKRSKSSGQRFLDVLILPDAPRKEYRWRDAPDDLCNGRGLRDSA